MNSNILNNSVDKSQIPPLHQKRILAFVNHFVISSCSFLNDFATKCEAKFIEVDRRIQKVEASLIIIEAKLASIPDVSDSNKKADAVITKEVTEDTSAKHEPETKTEEQKDAVDEPVKAEAAEAEAATTGVKACEDTRYVKFFKMLQFGVPMNAVKLKMQSEGVDPTILDSPNAILPDGVSS